jgi:hypothetical protein
MERNTKPVSDRRMTFSVEVMSYSTTLVSQPNSRASEEPNQGLVLRRYQGWESTE